MKRLTDAEVLLRLLGETCDCCECEHEQSGAERKEAAPARPQLFGKKMPPLTVTDTDQPFVVTYPERESPQVPEPGYAPFVAFVNHATYDGARVSGESGFSRGLLLDDGTNELSKIYKSVDMQARTARVYDAQTRAEEVLDGHGYAIRLMDRYDFDNINKLDVPPKGITSFSNKYPRPVFTFASIKAYDNYIKDQQFLVPEVGLCNQASGVYGATISQTIGWTETYIKQESDGVTFSGEPLVFEPSKTVSGGEYDGFLYVLQGTRFLSHTIDDAGDTYNIIEGESVEERRIERNLGWTIINYKLEDGDYADYMLTEASSHAARIDAGILHDDGSLTFARTGINYAGTIWEFFSAKVGSPGYQYYNSYYSVSGVVSTGKCLWKDDPNATYFHWDAVPGVVFARSSHDLTEPEHNEPTNVMFRSPVMGGRSFEILADDLESRALDCSYISGATVLVNGADVSDHFSRWSAFQSGDKLTLLLGNGNDLTVIPDLDVKRLVTVVWDDLLRDLGFSPGEYVQQGLAAHFGYHSFPLDRGFLLLQNAEGRQRWATLGPWDAYRDVSAAGWKSAGLSKPRTRKIFDKGQTGRPRAPTPPRPAHGLALFDLYPVLGDEQAT